MTPRSGYYDDHTVGFYKWDSPEPQSSNSQNQPQTQSDKQNETSKNVVEKVKAEVSSFISWVSYLLK